MQRDEEAHVTDRVAARVGPTVEARAARWPDVLLLALAVYIVVESGRRLLTGARPGESRECHCSPPTGRRNPRVPAREQRASSQVEP